MSLEGCIQGKERTMKSFKIPLEVILLNVILVIIFCNHSMSIVKKSVMKLMILETSLFNDRDCGNSLNKGDIT